MTSSCSEENFAQGNTSVILWGKQRPLLENVDINSNNIRNEGIISDSGDGESLLFRGTLQNNDDVPIFILPLPFTLYATDSEI